MTPSEKFFNRKQARSRRSITAAKRREKEKKERQKKSKNRKVNCDFCACPSHNALKRDAVGKKAKLLC